MTVPKSTLKPATSEQSNTMTSIDIDGNLYPLIEIRSTGDVLLDVHFMNDSECTKSIPKDALRSLRTKRLPIPSPRILYRAKLDTIKKYSEYFQILLKPQFAEGIEVAKALAELQASNQDATKIEADKLPRVKIVDEDGATKTFGRELIFKDMLNIVHGSVSTLPASCKRSSLTLSPGSCDISVQYPVHHHSHRPGRPLRLHGSGFPSYAEDFECPQVPSHT